MSRHPETNPHFIPQQRPTQPQARPIPSQQLPEADGGAAPPPPSQPRIDRRSRRQRPVILPQYPSQQDHESRPLHPETEAQYSPEQHREPRPQDPVTPSRDPSQQNPDRRVQFHSPLEQHGRRAHPEPTSPPQRLPPLSRPSQQQPGLRVPGLQKTKPLTWFAAVFCVIFWVIIIVGGLIVLIVYMVFRPRSPRFDISSVSLNAAYLDMGYLLNADVTVLANFTNPNRKVDVDFNYLVINLYYEDTLIASRAISPFSAASMQTMFADVHMVTSQVRLPLKDSQKFAQQVQTNGIQFQLKGYFRTRSKLGSFLRYSYWLYGKCSFIVTAPPSGVLVARSCRTKR